MLVKKNNKAGLYDPWEFAVNFGLNNFQCHEFLSGKEIEVSEEVGKGMLKEGVVEMKKVKESKNE